MKYLKINFCDYVNGPGLRTVLFVSGCRHHCKGCFQPETWNFENGQDFTIEVQKEILDSLYHDYIEGLTLLGGDPMEPENQRGLLPLIREVKEKFPDKNIWCYTGYTYEKDLLNPEGRANVECTKDFLSYLDVIIDGEFIEELKDPSLVFRGSKNQRIINLHMNAPLNVSGSEIMDFSEIKEEIKIIFANDTTGHDYWHSIRVHNNAMLLSKDETCQKDIIGLAALLHDVDDRKLFCTEHYDNAIEIMTRCGISKAVQEKVIEIIGEVSFKGTDSVVPKSIEGKIVQDADRLDAMGAIGIARTFAYGGSKGRRLYDPEIKPDMQMNENSYLNNSGTSINHFYEKLLSLKDMMNTDSAKKIAEKRDKFLRDFLKKFIEEWDNQD